MEESTIDLSKLYKGNLLNYLVLPLLGFSWKKRFGSSYITTKLSKDLSKVTVLLDVPSLSRVVEKLPNYYNDYTMDKVTYIEFSIPESAIESVRYITEGKIWNISDVYKQEIIKRSELDWCNNTTSQLKSSALLQCLYINERLFNMLAGNSIPFDKESCKIFINDALIYD